MINLEALRDVAIPIAREAGAVIMDGLLQAHEVSIKTSSTDLVTHIDRAAETVITERLQASRPSDSLMSEEGTQIEGTSGVLWVCDPLDGTANFVRRRHPFVVSLAALIDETVQVAVVYDPWLDELYEAVWGGGARMNGKLLQCSAQRPLSAAAIATAFGRTSDERIRQAAVLQRIIGHIGDIRRTGAAVYDICSVATNRSDGYFYEALKPWDLYAASLIATGAGAKVIDYEGNPASPGKPMLAASPEIADGLLDILSAAGGDNEVVNLDPMSRHSL